MSYCLPMIKNPENTVIADKCMMMRITVYSPRKSMKDATRPRIAIARITCIFFTVLFSVKCYLCLSENGLLLTVLVFFVCFKVFSMTIAVQRYSYLF